MDVSLRYACEKVGALLGSGFSLNRVAIRETCDMNPKVDGYLRKNKQWREPLQELRRILLDAGLTEEIKWRAPCYTINHGNVVIIGAYKEGCVFSFLKGALLTDSKGLLLKPGENTQAGRIIRFTTAEEVIAMEDLLRAYLQEAIAVEKAGLKVPLKAISEYAVPEEFQKLLDDSPELQAAFQALTPGRRRAYLMHFAAAKQSKTRESRIEKCLPQILAGKGLDDDYRQRNVKSATG